MIVYSQEQIFMFFIIIGLSIGLIYDLFRSLRKNIKTSNIITFVEDIVFIMICFTLIIIGIVKLNNGIVRLFIFIGIFFGILIYSLTISRLCVIIFSVIIRSIMCFTRKIVCFSTRIVKYLKRFFKIFVE